MFIVYYDQAEYDDYYRDFVFVTEDESFAKSECDRLNDIEIRLIKEKRAIKIKVDNITSQRIDFRADNFKELADERMRTVHKAVEDYINKVEDSEIKELLQKSYVENGIYFYNCYDKDYDYSEIEVK